MPPVVIENPILNSPFEEPARHFRFSDDGITDEITEGRRQSGYFLPIAAPRKKSGQMKFQTEWTQDRFLSSPRINRIRERVKQWRQGDVDVLVEFERDHRVGLVGLARMQRELESIIGRTVDLRTPNDLSPRFRDEVLKAALLQYAA